MNVTLGRRQVYLVLAAIVIAGAGLRVFWNDVVEYSPVDETVYLLSARELSSSWSKYPQLVRDHIADPEPPPSRWGGLMLTSAACVIAPCTHRTLAWVETTAGIAVIFVTFVLTRRLFGARAGLAAAALTVTAPIQLAMSRRALEDELFLLGVLLALWGTVAIAKTEGASPRLVALGIAAFTIGFSLKETFVLYYPALATVLLVLRADHQPRRGDLALFIVPPFLFAAAFGVLSHDPLQLVTLARNLQQSLRANLYVAQFQSGPFYEPLIDIYVLAPLVTVAGLVAGGLALRGEHRPRETLASITYVALLLVAYGLTPKDARSFMPGDTGFRMLAAWGIAALLPALVPFRAWLVLAGAMAVNAAIELAIFVVVFRLGGVYDPVLANILRALNAIPR